MKVKIPMTKVNNNACAEAWPYSKYLNALLKIKRPTIVVALSGPPPVIKYAFWNTWNEPITLVIKINTVVGFTSGSTMYLSFSKNVAPSISADS